MHLGINYCNSQGIKLKAIIPQVKKAQTYQSNLLIFTENEQIFFFYVVVSSH